MTSTETLSSVDVTHNDESVGSVGPFLTQVLCCARPLEDSRRVGAPRGGAIEIGRGQQAGCVNTTEDGVSIRRLTVVDGGVSTRHSRIAKDGSRYFIEDLGSKNGTFVNDARVERHELRDGDVIEVGNTFFVYRARTRGLRGADQHRAASELADLAAGVATFQPELESQLDVLSRVAGSTVPVLVTGESGTGKELLARAIHQQSGRTGDFVGVNCGALPKTLLESELFGYRKGAFSGATADRLGLVRAADGGTLFLDEIAELSPESQVALLRVLQEKEVRPVGDTDAIPVDVRIVSATHRNLTDRRIRGELRDDLFARIAGFTVKLPPLRQRIEDVGLIAQSIVGDGASFSRRAVRRLLHHRWPLNIRELEHALTTAVAIAGRGIIGHDHLPEAVLGADDSGASSASVRREGADTGSGDDERERLVALLKEHGGNVSAVARALSTSRTQVARLLDRYGIDKDEL